MFFAKISWFIFLFLLLLDSKVFHCQIAPNGACQKTNGRMSSNLSTRDDIEIRPGYDSHCLIESFEEANKLRCLAACNLDCLCYMLTHDGAKCSLYDHSAINYFMKRSNNAKKVYVKKDQTISGLIHHWSMDGSGIDLVGRHDLQIKENGTYASDRKGTVNSSIHFNYGYGQVPPDVYFDPVTGGFTVMLWVKFSSLGDFMRLIEFGPTDYSLTADNILITTTDKDVIRFALNNNGVRIFEKDLYTIFTNTWYHYTVSVSITLSKVTFYLDGANEVSSVLPSDSYRAVNRTNCLVGKFTKSQQIYFNGYMDDLKIFNRALTTEEVNQHMNL